VRLRDLDGTFRPLGDALESAVTGLVDAQGLARTLALRTASADRLAGRAAGSVERAAEALARARKVTGAGTAGARALDDAAAELRVLGDPLGEARQNLERVVADVAQLRARVDKALSVQLQGKHHGGMIRVALTEIGRIAHSHGAESNALRASADALRRDVLRLNQALAFLVEHAALSREAP
jgi:hypothetical protein